MHGLASGVGEAVTFSELCWDFEFLGSNSLPGSLAADVSGRGLPVELQDVSTFVEQFQYLIQIHLRLLCDHHAHGPPGVL